MIRELSIKNFATIDDLAIHFNEGFTALTGETGAGKSILLDALGLLLGERADTNLIRYGKSQAEISVEFDISNNPAALNLLQKNMIDAEANIIIIRRVIRKDNRSKAFINDTPSSISFLNSLGATLVDIQGQQTHQQLLRTNYQRQLLDRYSELDAKLVELGNTYSQWQKAQQELTEWQEQQRTLKEKIVYLREKHEDFTKLEPKENEFEQTMEIFESLNTRVERLQLAHNAVELLETSEQNNVLKQLSEVENLLESLQNLTSNCTPTLKQLQSSIIELKDIADQCRMISNEDELDANQVKHFEERLSELNFIARKYKCDVKLLAEEKQSVEDELNELDQGQDKTKELQIQIELLGKNYYELANTISSIRKQKSKVLIAKIMELLPNIGLQEATFDIIIESVEKPSAYGMDKIEFMISTNPGLPLGAISRVASGGEASRVGLAIQVSLANNLKIPTLVFDEVDVGVGGGVAEMIGKKMRELGESVQLLSVTHQGQVAAKAHNQLQVSKHHRDQSTFTNVDKLTGKERIREVARMVAGQEITDAAIEHATNLLQQ